MRVIGEINHPVMKITVFKMEFRLTVKFEMGMFEQAYRFRLSDELKDASDIEKMLTPEFLGQVEKRFADMLKDCEAMQVQYFQGTNEELFEQII